MIDQLLETFRKTSESSFQMQQDVLKYWTQQWLSGQPGGTGASPEWGRALQKRWLELTLEILNKYRESLDATYKAGIQAIEQAFHVSEAKSPEDYQRLAEELWRKLLDVFKTQYETQFQDFQKWTAKSFEMAQRPAS